MAKINPALDFRLLDVSLEIHALEDQYDLIKEQLIHFQSVESKKLDDLSKKLTLDEADWHFANQEYNHKIDFLYPRFFWGPFIVALYAVYETAVIEIAKLIQQTQKQKISINDLKGNFLERASLYYKHVINFELCNNNSTWEKIKILSELRNAIAHSNGRTDMLNKNTRNRIRNLEKQKIGITTHYRFIIFDETYIKTTFESVRSTLNDLVERYKDWDNHQKSV